MRISTWNVEWATLRSPRGRAVVGVLDSVDADVIVLTEGCADVLPSDGFIVDAGHDWGYRVDDPSRRKVLMWSRRPWTDVDVVSDHSLPSGRLVSGITATPIGPLRVVGVCVPWRAAHVDTGRRDRRPWEDHSRFLDALGELLKCWPDRTILAGDLNQRIPRTSQPVDIADQLDRVLAGLEVPTAGVSSPRLIDHIAHTRELTTTGSPTLIPDSLDGRRLSDHIGVAVDLIASTAAAHLLLGPRR